MSPLKLASSWQRGINLSHNLCTSGVDQRTNDWWALPARSFQIQTGQPERGRLSKWPTINLRAKFIKNLLARLWFFESRRSIYCYLITQAKILDDIVGYVHTLYWMTKKYKAQRNYTRFEEKHNTNRNNKNIICNKQNKNNS